MAFISPTGLDKNWLECLSSFPAAARVALASSSICIPNKTRPEIDVQYMFKAIFNQWSLGSLWKIISRSQSISDFAVSCRTDLNTQRLQLPCASSALWMKGRRGLSGRGQHRHVYSYKYQSWRAIYLNCLSLSWSHRETLWGNHKPGGFCPLNLHPETHHVTVQEANQFQFKGELRKKCFSFLSPF